MSLSSVEEKPNYLDKILFDNAVDELSTVNQKDRKRYITKALNNIPEDESVIVTLYYLSGNTVKEIAEITNLTVSNVKVKLFRARNKLYNELRKLLKGEVRSLL